MLKYIITIITLLVAVSCQLNVDLDYEYDDEAVLKGILLSGITNASETTKPTRRDLSSPHLLTENSPRRKRSDFKSCLTESGERGECVPYYLCLDGIPITDGAGIIDLRMGVDDLSSSKGEDETPCHYLDACCKLPDVLDENDPIIPNTDQHKGCGWRNSDGLGFKITGNRNDEAEFGEFPWMVAVLKLAQIDNLKTATYYIGGGSLIHPSVVLTAAHILETTGLRVRAGEWDTQTDGEQYPYQERDVAEVDVHEEYNKANVYYDAALLLLTLPFDLAPNVGLACISVPGEPLDMNGECFAAGWGKDKFGRDGQYQNILKKIDLHLVDHETCQAKLRTTRLQKYFKLHSSFICAGGEGEKDTCTGDGGSPLVCPIQFQPNRYKQVGIVSWGVQCGQVGMPAVYADVTTIGGWVDRRLLLRGLDVSLYRY